MPESPTILCIDDETLGLQIRKAVLEKAGYRVLTAPDGPSGLAIFCAEPVDVVVIDYSMPGMNGPQVATAMRKVRTEVPIVLLSAYVAVADYDRGSIDAFITKGEGPQALLGRIADMLRARSRERAL